MMEALHSLTAGTSVAGAAATTSSLLLVRCYAATCLFALLCHSSAWVAVPPAPGIRSPSCRSSSWLSGGRTRTSDGRRITAPTASNPRVGGVQALFAQERQQQQNQKQKKRQQRPAFQQEQNVNRRQQQNQNKNQEWSSGGRSSSPASSEQRYGRESGKYGSDSRLSSLHQERIRTAGRVGTKRYVNPCKVFVGNLPYGVDSAGLSEWISNDVMGLPPAILIGECKVVRDWKTGNSKGYGFVVFNEPIHATVFIDKCNGSRGGGAKLGGRTLTVSQGKKKDDPTQVYLKKKRKKAEDADEEAIQAGMEEAVDDEDDFYDLDPEEAAVLQRLDPDLVPSSSVYVEDDEDDDADMNRAQRREAARRRKRRKLPTKGFGS